MKVEDFELALDDQVIERERGRIAESMGYLTEGQVAMLAGVKKTTLESWRKRSKGPVSILFGNEPLYSIGNVKAFFEALSHEKSDRSHIRATL